MMATELHWTFEQIGQCDWKQVVSLLNHWQKNPPVSMLLNHYFRAKGLKLVPKGEPTDFERRLYDKSQKFNLQQLPAHLRGLVEEAQQGKYAGSKR